MCDKRRASLRLLVGKKKRPVQCVKPEPSQQTPTKSAGSGPTEETPVLLSCSEERLKRARPSTKHKVCHLLNEVIQILFVSISNIVYCFKVL